MPSAAAAAGWSLLWFGVTALGRWSRHPAPAGLVRLAKRAALAGAVLAAGTLLWPAVKGLLGVAEGGCWTWGKATPCWSGAAGAGR